MRDAITWRDWLRVWAATCCALAASGIAAAAETAKRPNVLIITTDQQRVDAAGVAGNRWVKTPHIDSIAAQGVYFTRSYCPYPLCSPSRSSLHTSRMPHEIRVDHNSMPIDPAVPLSGQVFRAAGYDTGYAGKWHMPNPYPSDGIAGFEVLNKTTRQGKLAQVVDEATMTAAIEFLNRKRDKPFLLVASFINPHDICLLAGETSPLLDDVWKRYEPPAGVDLPALPANFAAAPAKTGKAARSRHDEWDETHWRKYQYAYYRMVEDVDRQVGRVLAALRTAGQEKNTLVVFTSDHGEGLGSRRWTGKMSFFDEAAAVPLVVSWQGVTPPGRIDRSHLASALDVLPTICDYAGVKPPAVVRGQSLREVIETPDAPGREFVVAEMAPGGAAGLGRSFMVRTARHKYMVFPAAGGKRSEMLFDLEADPGETKNLAGDPAQADELQRHRRMLAQWNKTTGEDEHPVTPNPVPGKRKAKRSGGTP